MTLLELVLVALGLSMDALAVSIAGSVAVREGRGRHALRLGLYFGAFQALMPVLGWLAGSGLTGFIGAVDHWVAFGLLAAVGGHMIWESIRGGNEAPPVCASTAALLTLAVATSLDALAVGLSFALLQVAVVPAALLIGAVTFGVCVAGSLASAALGSRLGQRVSAAGGLILIGIGVKILAEHL
ncbi:MAG: manganese efflux pump MntP family protein [Elusimicrobiota bacterium]